MIVNAMLVRWVGGWIEVLDTGSVTTLGRHEALLSLGAQEAEAEARRLAVAQLADVSKVRFEVAADVAPMGPVDKPFLGYTLGDRLNVPSWDGVSRPTRITSMSGSVDVDGRVTFALEATQE